MSFSLFFLSLAGCNNNFAGNIKRAGLEAGVGGTVPQSF